MAADGQQRLQLAGLPAIPFQADRMDLQAALDGSALPLLSIASLRAELPAGAVTVDRGTMVFPADGAVLDAQGVDVPGGIGRAFGATIGELHVRAALTRPVPAAPTPAAQARAWRDAGGRLDAPEFSLHWGPLDVSGHVTGSLNFGIDGQFATYLGWLIPWGTPVTLLGDSPKQVAEAQRELVRISIDQLQGAATGEPHQWTDKTLGSFDTAKFGDPR